MERFSDHLLRLAVTVLAALAGLYACLRWVLPWLWPFLIAWAAAAAMEPAVCGLCQRGLKRGMAAGVCALCFSGAALGLLWLLCGRLLRELGELLPRLPELFSRLSGTLELWRGHLDRWLSRTPEGLSQWMERSLSEAAARLAALPAALAQRGLSALSAAAAQAPSALLFGVTAVIGTYFISAAYPELLHGAARLLPDRFLYRARLLRRELRRTLGRWTKAQAIMTLITWGMLTGAFLLLGVRYALLLAMGTAVIDALPVLGTGTVLVPWALYSLFTGDRGLGLGLLITYTAVTVLHSSIQAKLLGDQLGLHPLATLAAIYAGWTLWGVWGMLLFPILAICVKETLPGLEGFREEGRAI